MRRFSLLLLAAPLLSACIIVSDGDRDDRVSAKPDRHAPGAYLMVPFTALEQHETKHLFFHAVLPDLSTDHALTNTGNAEAPWYCFAYEDAVAAEYGRRRIQSMEGGPALAQHVLIDETCAAG